MLHPAGEVVGRGLLWVISPPPLHCLVVASAAPARQAVPHSLIAHGCSLGRPPAKGYCLYRGLESTASGGLSRSPFPYRHGGLWSLARRPVLPAVAHHARGVCLVSHLTPMSGPPTGRNSDRGPGYQPCAGYPVMAPFEGRGQSKILGRAAWKRGPRRWGGASELAPSLRPACVRVGRPRCTAVRSSAERGPLVVCRGAV